MLNPLDDAPLAPRRRVTISRVLIWLALPFALPILYGMMTGLASRLSGVAAAIPGLAIVAFLGVCLWSYYTPLEQRRAQVERLRCWAVGRSHRS